MILHPGQVGRKGVPFWRAAPGQKPDYCYPYMFLRQFGFEWLAGLKTRASGSLQFRCGYQYSARVTFEGGSLGPSLKAGGKWTDKRAPGDFPGGPVVFVVETGES